ncbi:hypothetical protein TSUD_141400 [Trifolium subterraneum]|uniref:RRM domain-containing protein n=1 Tax=Trifolium subterraneum TaxID=3900 RepID=A0A2Z6NVC0_TRISU|nr:hypothetical protein TSUD_141400 [Trifolium subterraneum]
MSRHETAARIIGGKGLMFNNVPDVIAHEKLREEFCRYGALLDVFLSKKRNARGRRFGFIRYTNVRDVDKMVKALNQVWFGTYKVCANVALFSRISSERKKQLVGDVQEEGRVVTGDGEGKSRSYAAAVVNSVGGERVNKSTGGVNTMVGAAQLKKAAEEVVVWSSKELDRIRANKAMVGIVRDVEMIATLQDCFVDAGFTSLTVAYLGGKNVLINVNNDDGNVAGIGSGAKEFFDKFFVHILNGILNDNGA